MSANLATQAPKFNAPQTLAARGFPVFPLRRNKKLPAVKAFPREATADPAAVAKLWAERPHSGVGVHCGQLASGEWLVVLDLDRKHGRDGLKWLAGSDLLYDMAGTFTVCTPSGGMHLYFRSPHPVPNSASKIAPGVDVRSAGGYVVGPGTVIDGVSYTITQDQPIAPLPEELRRRLGAPTERAADNQRLAHEAIELDSEAAVDRAIAYLRSADPAIEGLGGDDQTFRVACRVREFAISQATCLDLMLTYWNERCSPDWPYEYLAQKVENAYNYAQEPIGVADPAADFPDDLPLPPPANDDDSDNGFEVIRAGAVELTERMRQPDLIAGRIQMQSVGWLYGAPNVGKSLIAIDMAWAIERGAPWAGHPTRRSGVIVFAGEDQHGALKRQIAYRQRHGLGDGDIGPAIVTTRPNLLKPTDANKIIALIRRQNAARDKAGDPPVRLVVFDTLRACAPGINENDGADINKVWSTCAKIRDACGCAVLIVHHSGKDEDRGLRGHSSLLGDFDFAIRVKDQKIELAKLRHGPKTGAVGFSIEAVEIGCDIEGAAITAPVAIANSAATDFPDDRPDEDGFTEVDDAARRVFEAGRVAAAKKRPSGGQNVPISPAEWAEAYVEKRAGGSIALESAKAAIRSQTSKLREAGHIKKIKHGQWLIVETSKTITNDQARCEQAAKASDHEPSL